VPQLLFPNAAVRGHFSFSASPCARLDYCSCIFTGLPRVWIEELGRVRRATARLTEGFSETEHIQHTWEVLHWLPFSQGISYRIASLVLRCLVGQAPSYLCDLCHSLSYYTGRCTVYTVLLCRWQLGSIICSHCNNARHYFSVVNLPTCICLSLTLCTLQLVANSQFHQLLEIAFFRLVWVERASE